MNITDTEINQVKKLLSVEMVELKSGSTLITNTNMQQFSEGMDMEIYKCIKALELPVYDENCSPTNAYKMVEKDTVWEYTPDYVGESDARLYLKEGNSDFDYIDITFETMEECFERIG